MFRPGWQKRKATVRLTQVARQIQPDLSEPIKSAPKGIRIPVAALKGPCPSPLDDGGMWSSGQKLNGF